MKYTKVALLADLAFLICVTSTYGKQNKFCSVCENHTMCKYQGVGSSCKEGGGSGVSPEEKIQIVDVHNWYRRVIAGGHEVKGKGGRQPRGSNILKLYWDNDLAEVAQRWADQCLLEHDTCRDDPRWKVGQNIYWKWKYPVHNVNWTEAITSWYDEVSLYNPKEVKSYRFDPSTGHYTQLLWHDTHLVGCGRKDYGYNKIYVCNYGPTGNWIGEPLYTEGEPCSKCPKGTSCTDYLCDYRRTIGNHIESKPPKIEKPAATVTQKPAATTSQKPPAVAQKPIITAPPKPSAAAPKKPSVTATQKPIVATQRTSAATSSKPPKDPKIGTKINSVHKAPTSAQSNPKSGLINENIILDAETNNAVEEIATKIKNLLKKVIKKAKFYY